MQARLCGCSIIPSFVETVEDFIHLNIPEPYHSCQVYRYDIPEVICMVCITNNTYQVTYYNQYFCIELVHVDPVTVTEYLDTVQMDYNFNRGSCNLQLLSQQQQVRLGDSAVQIKCVQT